MSVSMTVQFLSIDSLLSLEQNICIVYLDIWLFDGFFKWRQSEKWHVKCAEWKKEG